MSQKKNDRLKLMLHKFINGTVDADAEGGGGEGAAEEEGDANKGDGDGTPGSSCNLLSRKKPKTSA